MTIAPTAFRAGGPQLRISRKRGAILRIGLSEPAQVTVTWTRLRAKRSAGSFTARLPQGLKRFAFPGRDRRGRRLAPGRYRAVAIAVDAAGNRSARATAVFKIQRG